MDIRTHDFVAGAQQAQGTVVIIDVFRAFSVACYCFMQNARRIIPVAEISEAWRLQEVYPKSLLIGEREGKKLPGFDFGNSPSEILTEDLNDRTLIHTTHAGTQGLVNAIRADEVLTGSLVNAAATAAYIRAREPQRVSLVRMGLEAREASDEDNLCAEYLSSLLEGAPLEHDHIRRTLLASPYSQRFFDPDKPWNPESDFHYCLRIDSYGKAIRARRNEQGHLELRPVPA